MDSMLALKRTTFTTDTNKIKEKNMDEDTNINAIIAIATQKLDDYGPELVSLIVLQSLNDEPINSRQLTEARNRLEKLIDAIDKQLS